MGLSILIYVILDGYDLGIGILLPATTPIERDQMIASIGPFWDANETWLVLAGGILLVAFPLAHGTILGALYLPTALMLIGLILRGVSFDFRAKVHLKHKRIWDFMFWLGSLLTTLAQGFMLGLYVLGLKLTPANIEFAMFSALGLVSGYILVGACWLILKTEGELQKKSVHFAKLALLGCVLEMGLISIATPLASPTIFAKWFNLPNFFYLLPLPLIALLLFFLLFRQLNKLPATKDAGAAKPFFITVGIFICGFLGLAYSFFPYVIPGQMTIWKAAAASESLKFILVGVAIVLPCIIGYTIFAYYIFRGKTQDLKYH